MPGTTINETPDEPPIPGFYFSWSPGGGTSDPSYVYPDGGDSGARKAPAYWPLTFTAQVDPRPGRSVVAYEWDFGDGTLGYGPEVVHIFTATNPHLRVKLCITDDLGVRRCIGHQMNLYTPDIPHSGDLVAWYRADAISGLADAASVATWEDQSGNGRHLVQATGAAQPTYQTNEINGEPVVRFGGTDDVMQYVGGADFITGTTLTAFVVARRIAHVENATLLSLAPSGTDDYTVPEGALIGWEPNTASLADYRNNQSFANVGHPGNGTAFIYAALFDGAEHTSYKNGTASTTEAATGTFGVRRLILGARWEGGTTARYGNYDLAEVLVYQSALSDSKREWVEDYLTAKYFA
jgi:hypothetical protein